MLTAQQIADNLNAKKTTGQKMRESSGSSSSSGFDPSKYGLSATDATESDHDKGIIKGLNGEFYQIDNFERQQKDDIDTDQGDVFSSSLEKDAGVDYTNFNTATDVENAIKDGDWGSAPEADPRDEGYTQSETLSKAKAGVQAYESEILPNVGDYITGKKTDMGGDFMNAYKLNLAAELEPRNADGSVRNSQIQQEKEAVKGNKQNGFE